MNKQQRHRALHFTPHMQKMHLHIAKALDFNLGLEVGEFIQFCLLGTPVKGLPLLDETLDI